MPGAKTRLLATATSIGPVKPPKDTDTVSTPRNDGGDGDDPPKFHLDKRAEQLLAADGSPDQYDDLLTTREVADWLKVSPQWVVLARTNGTGPRYVRISARRVAYRRDDVRAWLKERVHTHTKEYTKTRETAP